MRDIDARQLRHRLHRERGAAEHVRGIELVHAVFAHVDHGIAVQRYQRDLLVHRVDAREHDAVGAVAVAEIAGFVALLGAVGAHEQHIERLFGHVGFDQVLPHVAQARVQVAGKHLHVRERRADGDDHHGQRRDTGIEQLAVLFVLVGFDVLVARKAARRRLALIDGGPFAAIAVSRIAVLGAHICSGCAPAVGWLVRVCPARAVTVAPVACAFVIHTAIVTAPVPHASGHTRFAGNAHMSTSRETTVCPRKKKGLEHISRSRPSRREIRGSAKVSEGPCGARNSPEARRHRPLGHAAEAEGEGRVPQGPAASSSSAGRQAGGSS